MTHRSIAVALLLLAAGAVRAQAPEPDAPPRYEVEVLVFAHNDFDPSEELFTLERAADTAPSEPVVVLPAPQSIEAFPPAPFEPDAAGDVVGAPAGTPPAEAGSDAELAGEEPSAPPLDGVAPDPAMELRSAFDYRTGQRSLRFRPLRPEELKLAAQYRTLAQVAAYRPLLHVGWVQEVLSEDDARPFDLALLGVLEPSGTVRVHQSRYLHVTLDLRYQPGGYGAAAAAPSFGLDEVQLGPRYEVHTQRRIGSDDINYFDHPAFGVLIVVRPVPEPTPPQSAARPAA